MFWGECGFNGARREPLNSTSMGFDSISPAHLHGANVWMGWRNQEKYPPEEYYPSFT